MTLGQYWHEMIVNAFTHDRTLKRFSCHTATGPVLLLAAVGLHEQTHTSPSRIRQPGARAHRTGGQPGICILGDSMKLIASARGDSMKLIASCIGGGGATRCSEEMTNGRAGIW